MADLLIDTQLSPEQVEFVTSIQSSATALLTVINDILDFSKVESGKMEIDHVQFNLFHVVGDVLKMLAFEAEKKKLLMEHDIKLESGIDPIAALQNGIDCGELSPRNQYCVMGDPGRLRQILTNLISNSEYHLHGSSSTSITYTVFRYQIHSKRFCPAVAGCRA